MIVVDASLIAKLILRETDTTKAFAFVNARRGELHGPDLLLIELAGAVVRRTNENKLGQALLSSLDTLLDDLVDQAITLHRPTQPQLKAAAGIAVEIGHPLRDCIYLALAIELDGELATCDVRFQERANRFYPRIRLLADYVS